MKSKGLILALVLLFAVPAQAGIVRDLELSSNLVLHHDYRSGTYSDRSGNPANGTPTDVTWQGGGSTFLQSTSVITVADDATMQLTSLSITICGNLMHQGTETLVSKQDAGGTNYTVSLTATNINLYDGTNTRTIAASIVGKKCVTVQATNGATGEVFLDGIREGALDANSALSVDDAPLLIGNDYDDGDNASNTIYSVVIASRELTDTEAARLHSELVNTTWPTKGQSQAIGSYGPELMIDGDQEAATAAAYSAGNSATMSKEAGNVLDGSLVLRVAHNGTNNPFAYQTVLTVGGVYRYRGWGRGDGTAFPRIRGGGAQILWSGTTSTTWQYFDVAFTATSQTPYLQAMVSAAGYSEFDNVTVKESENPQTQFKTDWGTKTIANVAPGNYIPGTSWLVESGAFSVSTETVLGSEVKVITCTNDGDLSLDQTEMAGDPTQDAYGTGDIYLSHSAASETSFAFVSSDKSATAGYVLNIPADEKVELIEAAVGYLFQTTASYVAADTFYHFEITRSQSGVFTAYMDDTIIDVSGGSGTNPVTDTSQATSFYWGLAMDTGDKVIYSSRAGNYSISKQHGVNP